MRNSNTISLSDPVLGEEEKQVLCSVIDSGWITMGDRVLALERAFASLHGAKDAVAVNSCTAALHLCLLIAGIGPGDEVLVPSLTFVATVNAILYCGATPVFVDLQDAHVPHISLDDAEQSCTPRTKAVIVMHYGGYLMDLPRWRTFADTNGLMLIEDAAHAPAVGEVGRLSDAAAFSFFTNKNMTTAEGGIILVRDDSALESLRRMRSHGMTTLTLDRYRGHAYSYDVSMLGHNYRMDELRAALGLVQLDRLLKFNARRRKLTRFYRKRLADDVPEVSVPFGSYHETAAHLMPILLPRNVDRKSVMESLRRAGIQTSIHYPPVHKFSYYRDRFPGNSLLNTENFFARELTLPLHPGLTEGDVDRVVEALKQALQ
ncbi:MAG: DegT/DnrJ/EryC1/StrS aminotransferase family protein [Desulfobacteraceae bacterium]|nr:MAG: DegT/DnrJ/EryC1/StrS aminotransferase family protein [Desulfobacteraceae bacterium]